MPGIQIVGAEHPVFLVHGEHSPDGAVDRVRVFQDRHGHGHAGAVVAAQRGAVGGEGLSVVDDGDGVPERIVFPAGLGHADHIHMRLQDGPGGVLMAGGAGLVDDHIAHLIPADGQASALGPVPEKETDSLLMMGLPRDPGQREKILYDAFLHLFPSFIIRIRPSRPPASR